MNIVKRIILTLEAELHKARNELVYDESIDYGSFRAGFYRALGIVKRFDTKAEKEKEKK
jgi:hypothetical protein